MEYVIDVNQLEAVPRDHSDNKHIVRRQDLKVGLISVRPHDELAVHSHEREDQFYYVLEGEGIVRMDGQDYALRPGTAVTIPPGVPHGVRNPNDVPLRYLDVFVNWNK
ncbi:MAG: cupin domain-containing protein [Chloroflexi bacterium]|nr:cupin domain-containing protein [Chloroflexota bacterium]